MLISIGTKKINTQVTSTWWLWVDYIQWFMGQCIMTIMHVIMKDIPVSFIDRPCWKQQIHSFIWMVIIVLCVGYMYNNLIMLFEIWSYQWQWCSVMLTQLLKWFSHIEQTFHFKKHVNHSYFSCIKLKMNGPIVRSRLYVNLMEKILQEVT